MFRVIVLCILTTTISVGCLRDISYPVDYVVVDVRFKWYDQSKLPEQFKTIFYLKNISGNTITDYVGTYGGKIHIAPSNYSLIAVNNDTQGVLFSNEHSFDSLSAHTETFDFPMVAGLGMKEPSDLFIAKYIDLDLRASFDTTRIELEPTNLVSTVQFNLSRIEGLEYVSGIKIAITSLPRMIVLASGQPFGGKAAVNPAYKRATESINGSFRMFGKPSDLMGSKNMFVIQFLYGAEIITKQYDVTNMLVGSGKIDIIDHLVFDEIDGPTGGFDPEVSGWEKDDIEITI